MQEQIILKTKDDKKIYGVLDGDPDYNKLIVFVHGLTGSKTRHQFFNAPKFFNPQGFATFRFDLYSSWPQGRILDQCSINDHIHDLQQVISYFKDKFKSIYLVGHSLGGPVILGADLRAIKKITLWDPSVRESQKDGDWYEYNEHLDAYISNSGVRKIISKKIIAEWNSFDYEKWIDNCCVPLKVIGAGKSVLKGRWEKLIDRFKAEHEYVVIESAGHSFDEENAEDILFNETLDWFKK